MVFCFNSVIESLWKLFSLLACISKPTLHFFHRVALKDLVAQEYFWVIQVPSEGHCQMIWMLTINASATMLMLPKGAEEWKMRKDEDKLHITASADMLNWNNCSLARMIGDYLVMGIAMHHFSVGVCKKSRYKDFDYNIILFITICIWMKSMDNEFIFGSIQCDKITMSLNRW